MATIREVVTRLFGAGQERPQTIAEFDKAIARCEDEIAQADAETSAHLEHIELLESEVALDEKDEYGKQLEREQAAVKESKDRFAKFRAALAGLNRRRDALLGQLAANQRAAWLLDVRNEAEKIQTACAVIDVAVAEETAAWKDASSAAARLHHLMPNAIARRELAIGLEKLRAPIERPAMTSVALDIVAVALRCAGDEERAA